MADWQAERCTEIKRNSRIIVGLMLVGVFCGGWLAATESLLALVLPLPLWVPVLVIWNEIGDVADSAAWEQHEHEAGETND